MGKYLDIVREVEVRQWVAEQPPSAPLGQEEQTPRQEFADDSREEVEPKHPPATIYSELCQATPKPDVLLVFPDWQGLLVKSSVLGMSVWVVRSYVDGIALAKETGHPALMLDDVIRQKGRTAEESRVALLPALIAVPQ